MRNPFLIARFVLFSMLIYLNVMAIGFAAWAISALKAVNAPVPGSPVFIIFNACSLFLFMVVALAELVAPSARTAQVKFECGWTIALAALQLASAIDISLNGPPRYCYLQGYLSACASSSVLVAITWASSTILVLYFLALVTSATAHASTYGGVWCATVYSVPWFVDPRDTHNAHAAFPQESPRTVQKPKVPYENPVFRAAQEEDEEDGDTSPFAPPGVPYAQLDSYVDVGKYGVPKMFADPPRECMRDNTRPNWARRVNTRRGVDPPFAPVPKSEPSPAKRVSRALKSYWSGVTSVPPTPPPKPTLPLLQNLNGGFMDCHRVSYGQFPDDVTDYDQPIIQTRLTEWVRAERAVLVH